jgi:hypothetical protein
LFFDYYGAHVETLISGTGFQTLVISIRKHKQDLDEAGADAREEDLLTHSFATLPTSTVFVLFNCVQSSSIYNPMAIISNRFAHGIANNYLIHLNHEAPWTLPSDDTKYSINNCYGTAKELLYQYDLFSLVIRNYYYHLFDNATVYLPVGPSKYDTLVRTRDIDNGGIRLASARSRRCLFTGRFTYPTAREYKERNDIFDLVFTDEFPCEVYASKDNVAGDPHWPYDQYVREMMDSVFTPCPAGNTPETFRLHEALELGTIPILVRQHANVSYLDKWPDYPGPVLNSWHDLTDFFRKSATLASVDQLQGRIMRWHRAFKESTRSSLTSRIRGAIADT